MKKWLGESSSSCLQKNKHIPEETATISKETSAEYSLSGNESDTTCPESGTSSASVSLKMGLGVSSEPLPPTTNSDKSEVTEIPLATSTSCKSSEVPVSVCQHSVALVTSVNQKMQMSSPCHHFSPQTVSVQLHNPQEMCSSSSSQEVSVPNLMPMISAQNMSSSSLDQLEQVPHLNKDTVYHSLSEKITNCSQDAPSSSAVSPPDIQGLAISLPLLYPSRSNICHVHCMSDSIQPSLPRAQQLSSLSCNESILDKSSSDRVDSGTESSNRDICGMEIKPELLNHTMSASQDDYDSALQATTSKKIHFHSLCPSSEDTNNGALHSKSGTSASSGCGHWCSTCRVHVQVEVECLPGSERSPNGNRRGSGANVRTLSFPKKVRHKVKAPTKDFNGAHKKKKSPWSFRLNCRLRANKNDTEPESGTGISALNVGCVSCVCPGYRHSETEPVYRSVIENTNSASNLAHHNPMGDMSQLNPEVFSATDLEENDSQERTRDAVEGIEGPSEFIPILRENRESLALFDLQVLLERSLRFGLNETRTRWISYNRENLLRQMGPLTSETSLLSHTVHTQVDYIHCLVPDLLAITKCAFYWGKMDRYEAERLLENRPEGTFLLRDSAQEEYLFSVSFRRYERSLHARIEQWNHKFSFDSHDPGVFASHTVCGLIEHYKDPSCCMFFEPLLTNPLARTFPFHLQHLCRATICSQTTYDGINYLELPKSLKNYLKEYHYKQRVGVRHLD